MAEFFQVNLWFRLQAFGVKAGGLVVSVYRVRVYRDKAVRLRALTG